MERGVDRNDPFFQYTDEEIEQMTEDEFFALLEKSNEYVDKKYSALKEPQNPIQDSIP